MKQKSFVFTLFRSLFPDPVEAFIWFMGGWCMAFYAVSAGSITAYVFLINAYWLFGLVWLCLVTLCRVITLGLRVLFDARYMDTGSFHRKHGIWPCFNRADETLMQASVWEDLEYEWEREKREREEVLEFE